jgi:MerR family transcriptional regulator, copper efflux regulator
MSSLSIGELAERVGARPSALRYWERVGLLEPLPRVGGRRRYAEDAVARVGLIRLCEDIGFGISEIRELLETDPEGGGVWREQGSAKLAQINDHIDRLQAAARFLEHAVSCPHPSLSACPTFTAFVRWRAVGGAPPDGQ